MAAPEEVVASPLTIYLAPVGTAFPAIDDAVASFATAWDVLGTEGSNNYNEDGVSVSHNEETSDFKPAGSTMPTKRFRTGEDFLIKLNLVDIGPDMYAKVMNNATVTTVAAAAGVAGQKYFDLYRGENVASFAVIARGQSGVNNALNLQMEFSKAFVSVNGEVNHNKGVPAMLPVEIQAIRTSSSDIIRLRQQTAVAS